MKLLKSSLLKTTGVYTISTFFNAGLPFLLLPILSHYLLPAEYGLVAMFILLQNIAYPLVSLNVSTAIGKRKYYDESETDYGTYIGNSILLSLWAFIVVAVLFIPFRNLIAEATSVPVLWIYVAIITAWFYGIIQIRLTLWQFKEMPKKFAIMQVAYTLAKLLVSLLLVVLFTYGWEGRVFSIFISTLFLGIYSFYLLKKQEGISFNFKKENIVHAFKYGAPIIPHALAGFAIAYTDRIMINSMISLEMMGLYSVAYQLSSVFGIATTAFNMAFIPWLYKNLKISTTNPENSHQVVRVTYLTMIALVVAFVVLIFALPFAYSLLSDGYSGSQTFLFYLLLGFMFNGMYYLFCNYLFYTEKTAKISLITILSAIINIPLTYWLIKKNGALGAAQATVLVNMCTFIGTWIIAQSEFPMPWFSKKAFSFKKN